GELIKQSYGPFMFTAFRWLAKFKGLRGGVLDPFGRTEERRMERALIEQYRGDIQTVLQQLTPERHALALEIARLPEQIKGYGHVKERHARAAAQQREALLARWRGEAPLDGGETAAPAVRQAA